MDHGFWILWLIYLFIYKLINLFIYSQRRVQNFLHLMIKQKENYQHLTNSVFCVHSLLNECTNPGDFAFIMCLYHCMKEFSVNEEERLKTGHPYPLSGTLNFWGACPACTPNRITKLGLIIICNHKLSQHTSIKSALKIGLIFFYFEDYSKSAWGMILSLQVICFCTPILHKTAVKPTVIWFFTQNCFKSTVAR